jgi:Ca2+-binding RTX toxin-like protein
VANRAACTGNDILVGGSGDDTFKSDFTGDPEFNQTYLGNDTIMDWQSGHDHLVFDNLTPDMTERVAQVSADTVITFDHVSGSIAVLNAHATDFM